VDKDRKGEAIDALGAPDLNFGLAIDNPSVGLVQEVGCVGAIYGHDVIQLAAVILE
jgi:hypothetical protein